MTTLKANDRVTAVSKDGETYYAVIEKVMSNKKVAKVKYDDASTEIVDIDKITPVKRGRKREVDSMNEVDVKAKISALLNDLNNTDDQSEKKKIRRTLRRFGHRGGLNEKNTISIPN